MAEIFGSPFPYADPLWYSRGVSPYYNESHRQLRKDVRQYVDNCLAPHCEQWEKQGYVPAEVIRKHSELGYTAVSVFPLDREYAQGIRLPGDIPLDKWDAFHDLICIDEIVRCGCLGVVWGLTGGNIYGAPPLVNYGTVRQKHQFLPGILKGNIRFALAITEPDAGSDVAGIQTTAIRKGNVYVVNGAKKWITNGLWADYCTTAVRTGGPGAAGISVLIVPMKSKGVTCRRMENSGVSASGSTYIEFDDVEVPAENLLGSENQGFSMIMSNFNHERLWLACASLRLARVCAEDAFRHAVVRETFGHKLIESPVIRWKFSSFGRLINSAHAHMEELTYMLNTMDKSEVHAARLGGQLANLKVLAGRILEHVNREAQQVLGGAGYNKTGKGARIEQISRDLRPLVVGGGSDEILSDLAIREEIKRAGVTAHLSRL
ncbi:Acyl-CoA dehydrogenase, domain-containing protein [Cladophialophora immunda]|nr:Acyl-CoA dehydrogenase, domain-containing protein [Cladophialophora immunda]